MTNLIPGTRVRIANTNGEIPRDSARIGKTGTVSRIYDDTASVLFDDTGTDWGTWSIENLIPLADSQDEIDALRTELTQTTAALDYALTLLPSQRRLQVEGFITGLGHQ